MERETPVFLSCERDSCGKLTRLERYTVDPNLGKPKRSSWQSDAMRTRTIFVVTCILVSDTANGHAAKIGTTLCRDAAQDVIDEDKKLFRDDMLANGYTDKDITDSRPDEISCGEIERLYDIIPIEIRL